MKKQIKVNKVSLSNNNIPVIDGDLIFTYPKMGRDLISHNHKFIKLVVVSQREAKTINIDDDVFNEVDGIGTVIASVHHNVDDKVMVKWDNFEIANCMVERKYLKKVIAHHSDFSKETLNDIEKQINEDKLKDGHKILLECEYDKVFSMTENNNLQVRFNEDNKIIIHQHVTSNEEAAEKHLQSQMPHLFIDNKLMNRDNLPTQAKCIIDNFLVGCEYKQKINEENLFSIVLGAMQYSYGKGLFKDGVGGAEGVKKWIAEYLKNNKIKL